MTHRALYDYDGRSEKELTFKKDEFITVIREDESGWAEGKSGIRSGWFPISFVAPLPEPKAVGLAKVKGKKSKRMSTRFFGKDPKETKKDTRSIALSSSTTNEEEDDDDDEFSILGNKKKTSNYLSKWISGRNAKLKEKGLVGDDVPNYVAPGSTVGKSGTIYGVSLSSVIKKHGGPIPPMIQQCAEHLRKTSLKEEGIFRLSGVASQVDKLGTDFNEVGTTPDLDIDCNAVAGALKKFFRELPEPLFTFEAHDQFLAATRDSNKVKALADTLATIPRQNYIVIYYLMQFLTEVVEHASVNKMASSNVGIVFGPTLMRNKEETLSGIMNPLNNPAATITALVDNFTEIFGEPPAEFSEKESSSTSMNEVISPRGKSNRPSRSQTTNATANAPVQKSLADIMRKQSFTSGTNSPMTSNGPPEIAKKPPIIAPKPVIPEKPTNIEEAPFIPPKPIIPPKPVMEEPTEPPPPIPDKPSLPPKPSIPAVPPKEYAVALYAYVGDSSLGQLDFNEGDRIEIIKKHSSGWWTGVLKGKTGLFPMNFVEVEIV